MKKFNLTILAAGALAVATQIQAASIFSDNFDSENGGVAFLNYGSPNQNGNGSVGTYNTSFANWTVTAGSVDLIGYTGASALNTGGGSDYDFLPGHGLYVDLDGTMGSGPAPAGQITSKALLLSAGSYQLSFSLAGSQRGETKDTQIAVVTGVASETITLGPTVGFQTYDLDFTLAAAQSVNLQFTDTDTADQFGALLDNVQLTESDPAGAPDAPLTLPLLGIGFGALAVMRRRLQRAW